MCIITVLKRLELVLSRRYDCFFRVAGAHVVVLESLRTRDPIGSIASHLLALVFAAHPAHMLLPRRYELARINIALG